MFGLTKLVYVDLKEKSENNAIESDHDDYEEYD